MKRLLLLAVLLGVSSMLPGCPIYADDERCFDDSECAPGYRCDLASGACRGSGRVRCEAPADCPENHTCDRAGRCSVGDCTFEQIGCVDGYSCAAPRGTWECVADGTLPPSAGAGGDGGAPADSAAGAGGAT